MPGKDSIKSQWRNRARRAEEKNFTYLCEWKDCNKEFGSLAQINSHIYQHKIIYFRDIFAGQSTLKGDHTIVCHWRDCTAEIVGTTEEFGRHLYYHSFHQYLKHLGRHIQKVDKLPVCSLGGESRNIIPELPEELICRWRDCGREFDNPYHFYGHVGYHCEDFPKGKKKPEKLACRWEGCSHTVKTHHKIKEHMRSHTQAKVVACPTCGSLFSNNTKFMDHLIRQKSDKHDKRFVCSHCSREFGSARILRDHMRLHVMFYKCNLCDMTCPSPSHLRDHVKYRHSDVRLFPCDLCDFKAKSASDLRKHRVTHGEDGEEVISCKEDGCAQIFKSANHLLRHKKIVHGKSIRKYECHVCKKRCTRPSQLSLHLHDAHNYKFPSGHKKFRYKLNEDKVYRLQTIRYESMEVSQQVLGTKMASQNGANSKSAKQAESAEDSTDCEKLQDASNPEKCTIDIIKSPLDIFKRKNTNVGNYPKSKRHKNTSTSDSDNDELSSDIDDELSSDIDEEQSSYIDEEQSSCIDEEQSSYVDEESSPTEESSTDSFLSQTASLGLSQTQDSRDTNSLSSFTSMILPVTVASYPSTSQDVSPSPFNITNNTGMQLPVRIATSISSTPTKSIESSEASTPLQCGNISYSHASPVPSNQDETQNETPNKVTWQSNMGPMSFSPEKLGLEDTKNVINWWINPVKQEKVEPEFDYINSSNASPQLSPIDLSISQGKNLQNHTPVEEEEDSSIDNTELYNLKMLGAVALRTRQSRLRSQT